MQPTNKNDRFRRYLNRALLLHLPRLSVPAMRPPMQWQSNPKPCRLIPPIGRQTLRRGLF